jgi:DNA-directed RNA polymerase subunit RPC12/RpoP
MKVYGRTVYVCSKCGRTADDQHVRGWLIGTPKSGEKQFSGEMMIRCPQHTTDYAIRQTQGGRSKIRK